MDQNGIFARQNGLLVVVEDDLALVDNGNIIGHLLDLIHIMGCVDDGRLPLPVDLPDRFQDVVPGLRVDAHRRLIEIEDLRIVQEAYRKVKSPLHAAGKVIHPLFRKRLHASDIDAKFHAFFQLLPFHPPLRAEIFQVLDSRQQPIESQGLGNVTAF